MNGLGAYPDQSYYDPNRPSWLPYWIDTPTESAAKYGQLTSMVIQGNPTPAAGGNTVPLTPPTQSCSFFQSWDDSQQACVTDLSWPIALAAAGVVALIFLRGR